MSDTRLPRPPATPTEVIVATEQAIQALEDHPLAALKILPRQTVMNNDTRIFHGLGYPVSYYWIVGSPADVRVADGLVPESADPQHYFVLRASTTAVMALAVV